MNELATNNKLIIKKVSRFFKFFLSNESFSRLRFIAATNKKSQSGKQSKQFQNLKIEKQLYAVLFHNQNDCHLIYVRIVQTKRTRIVLKYTLNDAIHISMFSAFHDNINRKMRFLSHSLPLYDLCYRKIVHPFCLIHVSSCSPVPFLSFSDIANL